MGGVFLCITTHFILVLLPSTIYQNSYHENYKDSYKREKKISDHTPKRGRSPAMAGGCKHSRYQPRRGGMAFPARLAPLRRRRGRTATWAGACFRPFSLPVVAGRDGSCDGGGGESAIGSGRVAARRRIMTPWGLGQSGMKVCSPGRAGTARTQRRHKKNTDNLMCHGGVSRARHP